MSLAGALFERPPGVIAFVGAGGKTSALFRLGRELAEQGLAVLATTTTHMADPRQESARPPFRLLVRPEMEAPWEGQPVPGGSPGLTLLVAREVAPGKVKGVHPTWIPALGAAWDHVLVEADGSKRLPVKAPADYEPVLPAGAGLVVGVIGLDCLGRPMGPEVVHRPERFALITGCAPRAAIGWEHLVALAGHPEGLFKGAEGRRAALLNKADAAAFLPSRAQLAQVAADRVLLCSLAAPEGAIVAVQGARR